IARVASSSSSRPPASSGSAPRFSIPPGDRPPKGSFRPRPPALRSEPGARACAVCAQPWAARTVIGAANPLDRCLGLPSCVSLKECLPSQTALFFPPCDVIYLSLVVLGLRCCLQAFPAGGVGSCSIAGCRLRPSGKKFRSKPQLARYLGNTVDLSSFDFRTGKMMPSKLQKNKQRLRNDPLNQNKGKPDLNTTLPIRQTASIFKQPVTKVTNHPSNKVKSDPQRMNEQPRQLFWEKRLQGLSASDVTEQIIKTMELPKGLQGVGPGSNDETLLSAVASALHTSSAPITGQVSAAVEKNPAVWLNTSQPLCKAFIVTDEDIRKQEERVQQVRKKLEEALMADILSRAADAEATGLEVDSGDDA
ncbi:hypothetical protein G4228_016833, partial [Cervus hanglu yarkandensis]